jgi:hypothetical protein
MNANTDFPTKLCDSCRHCERWNGDCRICGCAQNPGDYCDGYEEMSEAEAIAQDEAAAADEKMGPGFGSDKPCHRMSFEDFCRLPGNNRPEPRRAAAARLPKTRQTKSRYLVWIKISGSPRTSSWRVLLETEELSLAYLAFMNCLYETRLYDYKKNVQLLVEAL